jgi:molybdenum cofactor cytidylyltransferase
VLTIGCAILAAGGPRRFGGPKQLPALEGRPLVRRAAAAACRSGCARVAVVSGAHDLTRALGSLPVERLDNQRWPTGMASSIHVAVAWADAAALDALLIAVADQPRLDAAQLDRLIAASLGGRVLAASAYAEVLGLPALFPRPFFAALATVTGDNGAREIVRNPAFDAVPVAWAGGTHDIDVPDDLTGIAEA